MTALEKVKAVVKALDEKKASDIHVIEIRDITVIADYFVIAGATSTTQVKALSDEVDYQLGLLGEQPSHSEGYQSANWVVLDYGDVVIHVFHKETREFYSLEKLWSDGKDVDVKALLSNVLS